MRRLNDKQNEDYKLLGCVGSLRRYKPQIIEPQYHVSDYGGCLFAMSSTFVPAWARHIARMLLHWTMHINKDETSPPRHCQLPLCSSSQEFPNLVVSNVVLHNFYAEALFCTLSLPFVLFWACLRCFALIMTVAHLCIRSRSERPRLGISDLLSLERSSGSRTLLLQLLPWFISSMHSRVESRHQGSCSDDDSETLGSRNTRFCTQHMSVPTSEQRSVSKTCWKRQKRFVTACIHQHHLPGTILGQAMRWEVHRACNVRSPAAYEPAPALALSYFFSHKISQMKAELRCAVADTLSRKLSWDPVAMSLPSFTTRRLWWQNPLAISCISQWLWCSYLSFVAMFEFMSNASIIWSCRGPFGHNKFSE